MTRICGNEFMGHLIFAGLLVFFVVMLVGKIYFSYIYAAKRKKEDKEEISFEIDEEQKLFRVKKSVKLFGWVVLMLDVLVLIYILRELRQKPEAATGLWMLIDLLILLFLTIIVLLIKGMLSYVRIQRGSFEYRDSFRVRTYSKEEIENVYRTTEFIFVKRRGYKMPVIIELIYNNNDCLYGLLRNLQRK